MERSDYFMGRSDYSVPQRSRAGMESDPNSLLSGEQVIFASGDLKTDATRGNRGESFDLLTSV